MELQVVYVPHGVSNWQMTREIAKVLHAQEFSRLDPSEDLINFRVQLNQSKVGGVRNDGSGKLTLPSESIGRRFLTWIKENPIKVEGKKLKFFPVGTPSTWLKLTLERTRYTNPDIEEEHEAIVSKLDVDLRVDAVQFGVYYRPHYPSNDREALVPRAFSIEWDQDLVKSTGWLRFEYGHKLIRIRLGDPGTDQYGSSIAIPFASINKIGVGHDGKPYLCFDTLTPPVLETIQFHRSLPAEENLDGRKFKLRAASLHPGHAAVSPYADQIRLVLYKDNVVDNLGRFGALCKDARLDYKQLIIDCHGPRHIHADRRGFFTSRRLYHLREWLTKLPWSIAFQIEYLLRNGLLNTDDILGPTISVPNTTQHRSSAATSIHTHHGPLKHLVDDLYRKYHSDGGEYVGQYLRLYGQALEIKPPRESPFACFDRVLKSWVFMKSRLPPGNFSCCHVTVTPTRLILEGPYAVQSNRVVRRYVGYEENFLRVDFRDENRLNYRWDREVNGSTFVQERVGGTLRNGFELGGRHFEFLAYSSSALREHAVWFMHSFEHTDEGWVTPQSIRSSLGIFDAPDKYLLRYPSKYAARLAQAFSATDPSVRISKDEWEQIPDIGDGPSPFTDGCGTITTELGDKIWAALCKERRDQGRNAIQPSAYQIRFLGYKGVVRVDPHLDGNEKGIHMKLRPSMHKFIHREVDEADIEIAMAFDHPLATYLNRPLVMLLEDRGIKQESLIRLQEKAVAEARMVHDSFDKFRELLISHSLGNSYGLATLLQRLKDLGLELRTSGSTPSPDTYFLRQLRQVAMTSVLRDIKQGARIPIPESYLLVGVADEGPVYKAAGYKNVYILEETKIYACIQRPGDEEPTWLKGSCTISRSPVVHPGDVQRVTAIGKPPEGMLCTFAGLKNIVVLPSVGERSLASCLGGGDLDGDLYMIIQYPPLLPTTHEPAAAYPPIDPREIDRDSTVDDICDFIVEYINSDVLGLLSSRHLTIADQSKKGVHDKDCLHLAALCSKAVDYAKHGNPINLDEDGLPNTLIRCKPDWEASEVVSPRSTDYYKSMRALGHMYRAITLEDPSEEVEEPPSTEQPLADPISTALRARISFHIPSYTDPTADPPEIARLFKKYADELRYICNTHTLSDHPGLRLLEAEVVIGSILAKCSQKRWRSDRIYRMRLHTTTLVREIQRELLPNYEDLTLESIQAGLLRGWNVWFYSLCHRTEFGASSFGLIGLGVVFDCLEKIGAHDHATPEQEDVATNETDDFDD